MKDLLVAMYDRSRHSLRRFEGVLVLALVEAVLLSGEIMGWFSKDVRPYEQAVACGMAFSFFIRLLAESRGRGHTRWKQHGSTLVFSMAAYMVLQAMAINEYAFMYCVGTVGTLCCFACYFLYSDENGGALFSRLLCGFVSAIGIVILIYGALTVCLAAFSMLLRQINSYYYMVLLVFVILVPGVNMFLSFLPERSSVDLAPAAFYKVLVRALLPIYLLLMAILYGYILKIAMMGTMPSGQMNWFASLAAGGYVVFYMCLADGAVYPKVSRYLRWGGPLLVPVLIVQLIGVYIRYEAYGLTTARFASMICIVYGVVVMMTGFFRCRPTFLYALAGIFMAICLLTPLNILDVPSRQQQARLLSLMEQNGMYKAGEIVQGPPVSAEAQEKIRGSYLYLKQSVTVQKFPFARQAVDSPILKELSQAGREQHLHLQSPAHQEISITGYTSLCEFTMTDNDGHILIYRGSETEQYDISSFVKGLYEAYKNDRSNQTVDLRYKPDKNTLLYFKVINIRKEGDSDTLHIDGGGYLLKFK